MAYEVLSRRECIACGKVFYSEYRDDMCKQCASIFEQHINDTWEKVISGEITHTESDSKLALPSPDRRLHHIDNNDIESPQRPQADNQHKEPLD